MNNRFANALLRASPRLVDVIAILLISAGINVLTSAPTSLSFTLTVAAGILLTASGVITTLLHSRIEAVRKSAETRMQVEIEAGNRFVESGGGQLKPEIATWQEHLTETIDDYLDSSPQAQRATTIAVFALILALSGVSCSIWPVLLPPFSNEQKLMVEAIALKRQMAALEREVAAESVKAEKRANVISDIIVRNEEAGRRERTNERTVSQRMEDLERQLARMNAELIEIKKMVEARTSGESKPSEKKD